MECVWVVFGTRPEAIKMAPVIKSLRESGDFDVKAVSTGQHKELLLPVLAHFDISPDMSFNAMRGGQSLNQLGQRLLFRMDRALAADTPDWVLVHGDTTTSLMAALAAFHRQVAVAHVEAGLRTGDMSAPFPEEMNRSVVGRLASLHFPPTASAAENLRREGVREEAMCVTGNTVIDALYYTRDWLIASGWQPENEALRALSLTRPILLITGHRRENFGEGFAQICEAIRELASAWPEWQFVYPVHMNPNVQTPVRETLQGLSNVSLIEPLDYQSFTWLMQACTFILTDSGGIQEEGPALGKPVLVMRDVTERPEAVDAGVVELVGNSKENIVAACGRLMSDSQALGAMSRAESPYGDGRAAGRITAFLTAHCRRHPSASRA